MGELQRVAMRPAEALLILDDLVGQVVDGLVVVPGGDGAAEARPPSAQVVGRLQEPEQVRPGAADARQRRGDETLA